MTIDSATAAFVKQVEDSGAPPLHQLTATEARTLIEQFSAMYGPLPSVWRVRDHAVKVPGGAFAVRLVQPQPDVRGVIVYFHGGGWTTGSLEGFEHLARHLALRTGCAVALVEYRLAPEHPYPVAVEDAWAAVHWANQFRSQLAGDPSALIVAGDSSGGNLAAVVSQRAHAEGGPEISLQMLVYPVTDCDFERTSYLDPANQLMLPMETMRWFWDNYVPDASRRTSPDASPLRGQNLSDLPPAVVITAEHDVLRDEGEAYVDRLREAGVEVRHRRFAGQMHGFFTMVGLLLSPEHNIVGVAHGASTVVVRARGLEQARGDLTGGDGVDADATGQLDRQTAHQR
jgi:acetyl esterase